MRGDSTRNLTKISYAEVAKESSSVIVIKPKDTSQTSTMTKAKLRKEINQSNFPIRNIRQSVNGGIVLQCRNEYETAELLKDAESKLGGDYDITSKSGRCPKVKIIGLTEEMSDEDLICSLIKQNHDIFAECVRPKIVQKFKTR